jgi:hypothetical protein
VALIGGAEPHDLLSMSELSALKSPRLTPLGRGILPPGRCRGSWGSMGLMTDDIWDVSQ